MLSGWKKQFAFTLTEMLVVILTLALLAALALPVYSQQAARGRQVKCITNLASIGKAALSYKANGERQAQAPLDAEGWAPTLRPFLGDNPRAMICPDDEEYSSTGLPNVYVRIRDGGSKLYDADLFHVYPFWREGSHASFNYQPAVWMMNDEEYQKFGIDHSQGFSGSNFTYNPRVNQLPQYFPGINPDLYWILMEDQRGEKGSNIAVGDGSLNDLHVRVLKQEGNQYECTFYKDPASLYVCDLILPWDIWVNPEDRDAAEAADLLDSDGNIVGVGRDGTHGPFLFHGLGELSYGMSSHSRHLLSSTQRILVVDYEHEVVDTGLSLFPSKGWDVLNAPRHFGKANVLWADGHVTTMSPDEIDPEDPAKFQTYWAP